MQPGDLYVLDGDVNKRVGHAVPRDPRVTQLRVSWVFRTVDANWVDPAARTYREVGAMGRSATHTLPPQKRARHE